MNLINATDYRRVSLRSALIVAPAALALIVVLLWFGSTRNPDPVSADEARLYSDCLEGSLAPCGGESVTPAPHGNGAMESNGTQIPGTSPDSGGGQDSQRCLLPGIPCFHDSGATYQGMSASVQVTQELRTY